MATGGDVRLRLALLLMPLATKTFAAVQPMFTGSSAACGQGHFCTNGVKLPCAPGRFGSSTEETSYLCSGFCPAGSFCPEGSSSPAPCGNSSVYCPAGSSAPTVVSRGNYAVGGASASGRIEQAVCPKGRYCRQGLATLCPAGTFGEREGLHDDACSGPCPAGWYCPPGAIDPFALACGGPEHYCPEGSGRPLPVDRGYLAAGGGNDLSGSSGGFSLQFRCPVGRYCVGGVSWPCPAGRFGASELSVNSSCTGLCGPGHYCPEGSHRADQVSEGHYTVGGGATLLMEAVITTTADTIVVAGTNETTAEQVEADTSLTSTRSAERLCEPGFWCEAGFRYPCEAGAYGSDFGATRGNCSGLCEAGFVCRNGSVSPEENPCGALSPPGSYADQGLLYTCPAGRYGASHGLSVPLCSGSCSVGFYCEPGSVSSRERACGGPSRMCPAGSGWPIMVDSGYYTTDYSTVPDEEACPPGLFRNDSYPFDTGEKIRRLGMLGDFDLFRRMGHGGLSDFSALM
ncbi:unnamed protein product [Ectocarpus fasciculatus]